MTDLPHSIPPTDEGFRLATIRRGESAELRVTLVEDRDGSPRVRLRAWAAPGNGDGSLWPLPGRSITVRMEEAGIVAEALAAVAGVDLDRGVEGLDEIRGAMRTVVEEAGR